MKLYTHKFTAMGGPCCFQFYTENADSANRVFIHCEQEVRRFEKKYSRFDKRSVLSKINHSSGKPVQADAETALLLSYADTAFIVSNGLFDITSGVFRKIWDFKTQQIPGSSAISETLQYVGWHKVFWQDGTIALPDGMELDLGGIVKEYAVDAIRALAESVGVTSGIVELGGDIAVLGPHPDGRPWKIGIRHPDTGKAALTIEISRGALASSGDYERYFEQDGQRYCHIISPETGLPVTGVAGVSVIAPHCIVAGTLATTAMLQGAKHCSEYLNETGLPFVLFHRKQNSGARLSQVSMLKTNHSGETIVYPKTAQKTSYY